MHKRIYSIHDNSWVIRDNSCLLFHHETKFSTHPCPISDKPHLVSENKKQVIENLPTTPGRFCKNMPAPLGKSETSAPQRTHNETEAPYTITFLPPGRFLYLQIFRSLQDNGLCRQSYANASFSREKPCKSFSIREENVF